MFRQARRAAAPDFLAVLRSVTFIQLCYPPPNPPRREQYNPTVNRPFLKSGSPKRREGFFVVCSNQHKRRAVLGLKARLLQRRCQSLKAAPLALYRGPSYWIFLIWYKKFNLRPSNEGEKVRSQGSDDFLLFPVGHPSEPEYIKYLGNETFQQAADKFPRIRGSNSILSHEIFQIWSKKTGKKFHLAHGYCYNVFKTAPRVAYSKNHSKWISWVPSSNLAT